MNTKVMVLLILSVSLHAQASENAPALEQQAAMQEQQALAEFMKFRAGLMAQKKEQLKITSPNGIDVLEKVRINGIDQWLSIRGEDTSKPVMLYLHGGPGSVTLPFQYMLPKEWEQNFIMVHWDQRATGKTRCSNPDYDPASATFEDFFADTVAVINYLRKRLDKKKVILLGHSWGSILGLHLARRHPELIYAYVGTGQVINNWKGEAVGYHFVLDEARRRKDEKAIAELEALAPYPVEEGMDQKIGVQRHYMQEYGASIRGDLSYLQLVEMAFFESPFYSVCDWMGFINTVFIEDPHKKLRDEMVAKDSPIANFDRYPYDYKVPIFFFLGAHDMHTPVTLAVEYFEKVNAPYKKLVIFEDSAHAPPLREAQKFVKSMINFVAPLANEDQEP